jgi:hypothetical protein
MSDQSSRSARLRYTATGALAALAAVGAIAGTAALAARPSAKAHGHAALASRAVVKSPSPTSPGPGKTGAPPPAVNHQPFLDAIQRLVDNGTITAAQSQVVDDEIQSGRVDTQTLAASGFTQAQLDAVQQALSGVKQTLAASVPRPSK